MTMKIPAQFRRILTVLMTTQFRYVLIAVVFVVALLGYTVLLRPQLETVRRVGILALQSETEELNDRQAYLKKIEDMVAAYRTVVGQQQVTTEQILPLEPQIGRLYLTLKALAEESGMVLESVAVTKGTSLATAQAPAGTTTRRQGGEARAGVRSSSATVQVLDVSLSVSGPSDYESFKKLLRNLEHSQRLFDVLSFNFKEGATTTSPGQTQPTSGNVFSVEMKTYYLEQATK